LLGITLSVLGCGDVSVPPPSPEAPASGGERFDPARTGTIRGRILWHGPVPVIAPFHSIPEPLSDQLPPPPQDWPNPNVPRIDVKTSALAGAVVWMRGVDPALGRPWDLPAVRVEMKAQQYHILQGKADRRTGFVRAHDCIELVSRDPLIHAVQVRGFGGTGKSAYFTCMLPDWHKVASRQVEGPEVVEIASAAGYFWMRAYLFVSDHPYLAHTDEQGNFTLKDVPAGTYDIIAGHPDWRISAWERNPDSMRMQQVRFRPPLTCRKSIGVQPGQTTNVELALGVDR
jgi:hypothetical protein